MLSIFYEAPCKYPPLLKHTFPSQSFCSLLENENHRPSSRRLAGSILICFIISVYNQSLVKPQFWGTVSGQTEGAFNNPQTSLRLLVQLLLPPKYPSELLSNMTDLLTFPYSLPGAVSGWRKEGARLVDHPLGCRNACALGPAGAMAGSVPYTWFTKFLLCLSL